MRLDPTTIEACLDELEKIGGIGGVLKGTAASMNKSLTGMSKMMGPAAAAKPAAGSVRPGPAPIAATPAAAPVATPAAAPVGSVKPGPWSAVDTTRTTGNASLHGRPTIDQGLVLRGRSPELLARHVRGSWSLHKAPSAAEAAAARIV